MAGFAGVRVEAGDRDARPGDAELALQVGVQDANHLIEQFGRDGIGHLAQGQVGGGERHAQAAAGEHHHDLAGAAVVGQVFGVAGEGKAGVVDDALVHRRGDDGVIGPVHAARDRGVEQGQHVGAVAGVEHARA